MRRVRFALLFALVAAISACANPYGKFYTATPNVPADARTMPGVLPATGPIQIFSSDDLRRDVREMRKRGWFPVGSSSFHGGNNGVTRDNLLAQADKVGAQAVLVSSKHTGTVTGAMPLILPNNSTSYSTGSATAYGTGGMATAYGSSTTTTYGTTTTMVPYSVAQFDNGAVYLVRMQQRLGVYPRPLDDSERQKVQTNSAVAVDFVTEGSPAFRADIFPNDYILAINGQPPTGPEDFLNTIRAHQGEEVELLILRGDQRITKRVMTNRF